MWPDNSGSRLGLIAGQGEFPLVLAEEARRAGREVVVFGVQGHADKKLAQLGVRSHFVELGALGRLTELLKEEKIKKVAIAGGVPKNQIYNPGFQMDEAAKGFIGGEKNKGDDHLLRAFELYLKVRCGVSVIDPRSFLKSLLAPKGVLTRAQPTQQEWEDLKFGLKVAKMVGRLDIGQTVVVKAGAVLAVEAIEGTDAAIGRGGGLGHGGAVVVKACKPNQDLRFDLPCVGRGTLESMRSAFSRVLGVEARKTILLSKDALVEAADRENFVIVGI